MLIRTQVDAPGFLHGIFRSLSGIWVPLFDAFIPRHQNVLAVLGRPGGKYLIPASNIVTNAGDIYYAQKAAGETPTNAFGVHELASAGTPGKAADRSTFTMIGSTEKAHTSTYPKTNDGDADNTGAGTDIVTYLATYAKGDFTATGSNDVSHGIITNVTPGASEPILTGFAFAASFEKTSDDTLKVFVNHEMSGQ